MRSITRSAFRWESAAAAAWFTFATGCSLRAARLLRFGPDERYVGYVTNFGQKHDVWPRAFAADDLRVPSLKNALVMQVELDGLSAIFKRELLSTTRDRPKRGDAFSALYDGVRESLADEPALIEDDA